jgi:hypothetical protein
MGNAGLASDLRVRKKTLGLLLPDARGFRAQNGEHPGMHL